MPESVTDRPTLAHEQVFLLTKAARFPDFALEVRHQDGAGKSYRQTGSAKRDITRGRALGLLRLFATVLEKGGAE